MNDSDKGWWNGPLPWLAYLPFYAMPWLWAKPSAFHLALSVAGLTVFLPVYLMGSRLTGTRLVGAAAVVLAVGIVLAPAGGAWTVFPIYAAAMCGQFRPARPAMLLIVAAALATIATGLLHHQSFLIWLPGLLLVLLTGGATISRVAFYDRTIALLATQEEVRRLAGTAERERIARDLHDVVGRTLVVIALKADLAARLAARDPAAAEAEMRIVAQTARSGLEEVRAALDGQAGGSLAHEVAASATALEAAGVDALLAGDTEGLPTNAGAILAMTLREAVTNVIRHAGAHRCAIEVAVEEGAARLVVVDDGRGGSFREGNGLTGMRQRLVAAGGTLKFEPGGRGTRLVAIVPA